MGRYIKKSKIAIDVSVKDISYPTTLGFRTRAAKNLALQRLRPHSTSPSDESDSFRYLQLRSRRLVKLLLLSDTRKQQKQQEQLIHSVHECQTRNPKAKYFPAKKSEAETTALVMEMEEDCGSNERKSESDCNFGDKGFDLESVSREMTPCSLRSDSEAIQSTVPSSQEIEDFFAFAEKQQQRFFMEKYNFDIVSENPLPGRYEWLQVLP